MQRTAVLAQGQAMAAAIAFRVAFAFVGILHCTRGAMAAGQPKDVRRMQEQVAHEMIIRDHQPL